ncbi:nuclear transport factor 2 family protein [Sphingomonas sp.]|uniref:nuclear transport factor 2 family protein n=1 Tax=Sphingomonas sp. TaxID=28214 RepID=UPI002DD6408E|nr:nuclear transport factor 2 family protein [Sphingomonas sp.]
MDAIERLLIENACKDLMTRYCITLDTRDVDGFLGLFAEDGVWELVNDTPRALSGRDAIRGYFEKRQTSLYNVHLLQNAHVEVKSPTEAEGYCIALIIDGPAGDLPVPLRGTEMITQYTDQYRLLPEGWRIVRRSMTKLIDKKSPKPE